MWVKFLCAKFTTCVLRSTPLNFIIFSKIFFYHPQLRVFNCFFLWKENPAAFRLHCGKFRISGKFRILRKFRIFRKFRMQLRILAYRGDLFSVFISVVTEQHKQGLQSPKKLFPGGGRGGGGLPPQQSVFSLPHMARVFLSHHHLLACYTSPS